ncbi:MAG: fluoride efflux transporter FluC [Nocardioidaceae bacterium]
MGVAVRRRRRRRLRISHFGASSSTSAQVVSRHAACLPGAGGGLPWSTFAANAGGCLLIGVLVVCVGEVWRPGRLVRPFLGVWFLGALTTFSTFSLETFRLLEDGAVLEATLNVVLSLVLGLAAAGAAFYVVCVFA